MSYFESKKDVVQFVDDMLTNSSSGSPLIMTIGRDKSGDFYAHTVIDMSSEDTGKTLELAYCSVGTGISQANTQAG